MTGTPLTDAPSRYRESLSAYSRQLVAVQSHINLISNLRLAVVISAIVGGIVAFRAHAFLMMSACILAGITLFIKRDSYKKVFGSYVFIPESVSFRIGILE